MTASRTTATVQQIVANDLLSALEKAREKLSDDELRLIVGPYITISEDVIEEAEIVFWDAPGFVIDGLRTAFESALGQTEP